MHIYNCSTQFVDLRNFKITLRILEIAKMQVTHDCNNYMFWKKNLANNTF